MHVWVFATLNLTFIATTAWTASRRDGGDGCQGDVVEHRWDDSHQGWPERAKCSNESAMVRFPDHRFCRQAGNLFPSLSSLHRSAREGRRVAHPRCVHISLGMQYLVSLSDGHMGTFPLSWSKTTRKFNRACACTGHTRPYHATRNRTSPSPATNCTRDAERRLARASCGPLFPPYCEPLRLHLW
jgi:hypothetical protein